MVELIKHPTKLRRQIDTSAPKNKKSKANTTTNTNTNNTSNINSDMPRSYYVVTDASIIRMRHLLLWRAPMTTSSGWKSQIMILLAFVVLLMALSWRNINKMYR
jgi:hypothetical protein